MKIEIEKDSCKNWGYNLNFDFWMKVKDEWEQIFFLGNFIEQIKLNIPIWIFQLKCMQNVKSWFKLQSLSLSE